MNRIILTAVLVFVSASVQGEGLGHQSSPDSSISTQHMAAGVRSDDPSQFHKLLTKYRFEDDGTGQKEVIAKFTILSAMGASQSSEQVFEYRPPSEELRILYVRVRKKNGTILNIETNAIQRQPTGSATRFDLEERRIRIPDLAVGDVVEYDVATILHRPIGPHEFYMEHSFQLGGIPDQELAVDIPANRQVKVRNIPTVKLWKTFNGKRDVYHWKYQTSEAGRVFLTPYVPGHVPDVQVSSFQSWQEVGHWYKDLERVHRIPTREIKAKAEQLTEGLNSEIEKVQALYNFTAKKISYSNTASLDVGGYEPRSAEDTLHSGYGDCKDKVTLLAALLEADGMQTSSVLISPSRQIDHNFPSPWPFTHVIALLHLGKQQIWMDPSSPLLPFRMLVYPIRGKQGLTIPPDGAAHFEETPAEAEIPSTWSEAIDGELAKDGSLKAEVKITARGDAELPIRLAFVGPIESAWPMTVQGLMRGMHQEIDKVSDVIVSDPINTDLPFTLSFQLSMSNFAHVSTGKMRLRPPLASFDLPPTGEEGIMDSTGGWHRGESEPVRFGPLGTRDYRLKLTLPAGYHMELREPLAIKSKGIEYSATYVEDGNSLTVTRTLVITRDNISAVFRSQYADFRGKVSADMERKLSAKLTDADTD